MREYGAIAIGSGIGGLVTAALLARYGKRVIVCESHAIAGGAAHGFSRQGFHFDSGPSFYCGLGDSHSLNPLRQVLELLGESVQTIPYDPLGHYHLGEITLPIYGSCDRYRAEIAAITPTGAKELQRFEKRMLSLYDALKGIPTLILRSDRKLLPVLLSYWPALLQLLPHIRDIQGSVGQLLDRDVKDPFVRRLIDLECFLLSGFKAHGTIAPEVAFMFGERSRRAIDYPIGGSTALIEALVRGLIRWGGELRLNAHVDRILVETGRVTGVRLRNGTLLKAPIVISNATIWDTYNHLLPPEHLPESYRRQALETPVLDSFMHLHLGIKAEGLTGLTGHHVVVHHCDRDLTEPGNTCMISIPSVWDPKLAPRDIMGFMPIRWNPTSLGSLMSLIKPASDCEHNLYFEPLNGLFPICAIASSSNSLAPPSPMPNSCAAIAAPMVQRSLLAKGTFPSIHTPIAGLYRVGDSTLPGIGVPAVAASGILCANTLVEPEQTAQLLKTQGT